MIDREKIHDLVEVFYQPTFKTFFVNSVDGNTFTKPTGIFVSLGITTSLKVLIDIRDVINSTDEYTATLVEISSKKIAGQFLNTVTNRDPKQYEITDFSNETIMDFEESTKELERLKKIIEDKSDKSLKLLKEYAPKITRLKDLMEKLNSTNGWNAHLIQKTDSGDYRIFHKFVNYNKVGDLEYRLGIYVVEKDHS